MDNSLFLNQAQGLWTRSTTGQMGALEGGGRLGSCPSERGKVEARAEEA